MQDFLAVLLALPFCLYLPLTFAFCNNVLKCRGQFTSTTQKRFDEQSFSKNILSSLLSLFAVHPRAHNFSIWVGLDSRKQQEAVLQTLAIGYSSFLNLSIGQMSIWK